MTISADMGTVGLPHYVVRLHLRRCHSTALAAYIRCQIIARCRSRGQQSKAESESLLRSTLGITCVSHHLYIVAVGCITRALLLLGAGTAAHSKSFNSQAGTPRTCCLYNWQMQLKLQFKSGGTTVRWTISGAPVT